MVAIMKRMHRNGNRSFYMSVFQTTRLSSAESSPDRFEIIGHSSLQTRTRKNSKENKKLFGIRKQHLVMVHFINDYKRSRDHLAKNTADEFSKCATDANETSVKCR